MSGIFLLASALTQLAIQGPSVVLRVNPTSTAANEPVVVSWAANDADDLFISGLGRVATQGERSVRLTETTTFVAVAEGRGGVSTASVTATVINSKSDDGFPDPEDFLHPFRYQVESASLPQLLDRIHGVLQDTLHYSVRMLTDPTKTVTLFTTRRSTPPDTTDSRIARARLAYLVDLDVPDPGGREFRFTIRTLLEYQRRVERTWRRDTGQERHELKARHLADLLRRSP